MKKQINILYILNIVLSLLVIAGDICYLKFGTLWLKSITSAGFVLIGIVNFCFALKLKTFNMKFCIIMLIGLTFAMLGDIVLYVHFMAGAILFAIGHVFYFVAYCFIIKFKWLDLIPSALLFLFAVLFITLAPIFDFGGITMQILCIAYALVISCMMGKAVSNFIRQRNILNFVIMLGSILFVVSDLMLLIHVFGGGDVIFDIICLATYYTAECLLAHSLVYTIKK